MEIGTLFRRKYQSSDIDRPDTIYIFAGSFLILVGVYQLRYDDKNVIQVFEGWNTIQIRRNFHLKIDTDEIITDKEKSVILNKINSSQAKNIIVRKIMGETKKPRSYNDV